jgi:26S proteasome regulatory subunit N9
MIKQKIHLSALLSLIFSRPPHSRTLGFQLIADGSGLPVEEVEYLVLKAFSVGLVKGTIDQVEQTVKITWMQGRVLNTKEIEGMKDKLEGWGQGVKELEKWVHREGKQIWVK